MLGHYPNVEKTQLLSYVEDYLECVESLPLDIQRNVSILREIDSKYQGMRTDQLALPRTTGDWKRKSAATELISCVCAFYRSVAVYLSVLGRNE